MMFISERFAALKRRFEKPFETLNKIYISKEAILSNYDLFCNMNKDWSVLPVLKSNAYGHGIKEVAWILRDRKIPYIVVDSFFEALKVREVNKTDVLLIGYTLPENLKNMDFSFVTLTVYDFESLQVLASLKKKIKIHLKIDTGMHRQGIYLEDLPFYLDFIASHPRLILEGVCTHLADADNSSNSYSHSQEKIFKDAVDMISMRGFHISYIHLDNSAGGTKSFGEGFVNTMRLGISLYGINPLEISDPEFVKLADLKPALTFESTLILKKNLKRGEFVSYNGLFKAPHDMMIGIVPVGYYEGLSRKLSNNYEFYRGKDKINLIGRVCMNLVVVDLTGIEIEKGEKIEIIGNSSTRSNNVYSMAKRSETITYECLTRLSQTIRRIIK